MTDKIPARRCAIYVRKSSDEGLDMSYNSLEAQTDACAAYIASQMHEGWVKLSKTYEDGGYSGGNIVRPGLQELLADVGKGQIDIIVVYKIDRLTRSLTDFVKLNDLLDKHQVSFVAVTQQFNTSTSMGRLTLNVLLSFAQFEREVAGERIRDKFAASKKKGIWMGGPIPLGYRAEKRQLHVVPEEAEVVRHLYSRYLAVKSVQLLQKELSEQGIRSKVRKSKDGQIKGGIVMVRGAIRHMLKNPLYLGLIRNGKELHQGQHEAIVNQEQFDAVQATLNSQSPGEKARSKRPTNTLLKGIVFDATGNRLQPNFCNKKGKRYHYYTSAKRLKDTKSDPHGMRIPAGDLEHLVISVLAARLQDKSLMQQWLSQHLPIAEVPLRLKTLSELATTLSSIKHNQTEQVRQILERVTISKTALQVRLSEPSLMQIINIPQNEAEHPYRSVELEPENINSNYPRHSIIGSNENPLLIILNSHLLRSGKQVKMILGNDKNQPTALNPKLIAMAVKTRHWFDGLKSGDYRTIKEIAAEENCDKSYIGRLMSIAFLAPDILERILSGDHSATLTPERLRKACPLPLRWEDQRALLLQ